MVSIAMFFGCCIPIATLSNIHYIQDVVLAFLLGGEIFITLVLRKLQGTGTNDKLIAAFGVLLTLALVFQLVASAL